MRVCNWKICNNGRVKIFNKKVCCKGCKYICRQKCWIARQADTVGHTRYKDTILDGFICKDLKEESDEG